MHTGKHRGARNSAPNLALSRTVESGRASMRCDSNLVLRAARTNPSGVLQTDVMLEPRQKPATALGDLPSATQAQLSRKRWGDRHPQGRDAARVLILSADANPLVERTRR